MLKILQKKTYRPTLKLKSFPISTVKTIASSYNKTFHSKLFTLFSSSESDIYHFAYSHTPNFKFCFTFLKNDEGRWYQGSTELENVRQWVLEQAQNNPKNIFKLYNQWEKEWKKYGTLCAKLNKTNLEKLNKENFYKLFEQFHKQYIAVGSVAYMADSFMSTGTQDWLEQLISEELIKSAVNNREITNYVRTLTSPVHFSFTLEAEYELLKTALAINTSYPKLLPYAQLKPKIRQQLKNLEHTFHWIQNNYYNVHYLTAEEFYQEIVKIITEANQNKTTIKQILIQRETELSQLRESRQKLIDSLPLSSYAKNVLEIARLFSKWKDVRKSGVYRGMYYFDRFLEEIARRTDYNKRETTFMIFNEMKDILFKKKEMHKELAQRAQQCFFAVTSEGYFIVGGKDADEYFVLSHSPKQDKEVIEIRGVSASPGYARGRVRIIRKTEEMKEFQVGEMLVTNQTTPEFMPIMKKAAAIVTEQGGITSHAAIVARELGKPCVIGTKIATSALRDGEVVEVDANNGIVRREK